MEVALKRLMISGLAAVALLALAATMLWSHSLPIGHTVGAENNASLQERRPVDANKLVVEEFEDMTLVFSAPPKR
jgi:hypothetical protein